MNGTGVRFAGGDRLKQLDAFCHSARLGSFTRAADYLSSNQSTVSQQVRGLERELELMLFERSGPNIRLTPIGRELLRIAFPVVMEMDRMRDTFQESHLGILPGTLAIAASTTSAASVVAGHLAQFRERHPEVRIRVMVGSGSKRLAWLRGYEVELVFGAMDAVPPDLEFHRLFTSRVVLITPADHPLAGSTAPDPLEIASFPMLAHPRGHYTRDLIESMAWLGGGRVEVTMELRGWEVIRRYVELGVGVAVVPEYALDKSDRTSRIGLDHLLPPRPFGVYRRREGAFSLPARRFLALVEPDPSSGC